MLPTTDETLNTARLLKILNDELRLYVAKLLLSVREEFWVADYDQSIVSGTSSYRMPPRAVGTKLRKVAIIDTNGNENILPRLEPEHQNLYSQTGTVQGFVVKGSNLVLVPSPTTTSGTLRMSYFQRPNRVVGSDEVGEITAINTSTKQVTISDTPVLFTATGTYDFVRGTPNFENLAIDQASTTLAANVLTFSGSLPSGLAVGDYVCIAGQTPIPQIPVELHSLLAQRVAFVALQAVGDPKVAVAKAALDEMRMDAMSLLEPRVEGAPRKVVNYNGPGWGWRNRRRGLV